MNLHLLRMQTVEALRETREAIADLPDERPSPVLCPQCGEAMGVHWSRRTGQWFVLHAGGRDCALSGQAWHRLGESRDEALKAWRETL